MKNRVILALLAFNTAFLASAQDVSIENPISGVNNFGDLAKKIFTGLTTIILAIVPILIIVGAFQMMTASGDPEKFKKGQRTIVYAVIGLVVILIAQGIVAIVRTVLTTGV